MYLYALAKNDTACPAPRLILWGAVKMAVQVLDNVFLGYKGVWILGSSGFGGFTIILHNMFVGCFYFPESMR